MSVHSLGLLTQVLGLGLDSGPWSWPRPWLCRLPTCSHAIHLRPLLTLQHYKYDCDFTYLFGFLIVFQPLMRGCFLRVGWSFAHIVQKCLCQLSLITITSIYSQTDKMQLRQQILYEHRNTHKTWALKNDVKRPVKNLTLTSWVLGLGLGL